MAGGSGIIVKCDVGDEQKVTDAFDRVDQKLDGASQVIEAAGLFPMIVHAPLVFVVGDR